MNGSPRLDRKWLPAHPLDFPAFFTGEQDQFRQIAATTGSEKEEGKQKHPESR
jgi:hypothetical protein